jgi:hypothetical protein
MSETFQKSATQKKALYKYIVRSKILKRKKAQKEKIMKNNSIVIETVNSTMETAVNHEVAREMILVLTDKKKALEKKIAEGPNGEPCDLSAVKIAAIKEEIADVEKSVADYQTIVSSTEESFSATVETMSENNERENVLTFIRLLAGIENSKLMKYAIPATEDLTGLAEALDIVHLSGKYGTAGNITMSKEAKEAFKNAKERLSDLIFNRFSLNETVYTKKLSIRLNSTDIGLLHECYVTGIKNVFDKNGNYSGRQIQTRVKALNGKKTNVFSRFDGLKTVLCDIMVEKVCK